MRIAFFDAASDELTSQKKGLLFEKFTARLVELSGYRDIAIRAKRASLEYDIEANSALHDRKLYGEAKAHEASMSGKEASAFVGKLLPLAVGAGGVDGLFISTSPFTPEAEDYLRSLTSAGTSIAGISLRTLAGDQIAKFLNEGNVCISETHLREKAAATTGLAPCDAWITVADRGDFFIVTLGQNIMSTAANFAAFSLTGDWLTLNEEDTRRLSKQISDLEELQFVSPQAPDAKISGEAQTLPTVVAGSGWFDYKFPSPPECFIGRDVALVEIDKFLGEVRHAATTLRAAQVLSRSGVGKSSLLLKVAASDRAVCAVTVDGRNLRVPSDLRLIAAELVELVNQLGDSSIALPASQDAIRQSFTSAGSYLRGSDQLALIQIDQFEALLARPNVARLVQDRL
ncbi:restriction endonuclease [Streptomyces sp. NPDC002758]